MRKIKFAIIMALAIVPFFAQAQLPQVKVENRKGEIVNTGSLVDGKTPMIISFWAVTCKPCIRELDAIYDALPDWAEEADFKVVAVSTDDSRLLAKAKSFAEGRGWGEDFTLLFDKNQDFMRAMNVSVVPHVFVLDAKGKVVFSHTSYVQGGEVELFEAVKKASRKK